MVRSKLIDGFAYAIIQPSWSMIIISRNKTSGLDFRKERFEVLFDEFVSMISVYINPIEILIIKLQTRLPRRHSMDSDKTRSDFSRESAVYEPIDRVKVVLVSSFLSAIPCVLVRLGRLKRPRVYEVQDRRADNLDDLGREIPSKNTDLSANGILRHTVK